MSFKIPCGGFKLDEKLFSLDKNDVLSIPKPLTYDYMPEGYPKKDGWSVEWDGNIDGKVSAIGDSLYKFSDRVLSYEEFLSAWYVNLDDPSQSIMVSSIVPKPQQQQIADNVTMFMFAPSFDSMNTLFVVSEDNAEAEGIIFPTKGLYVNKDTSPFKLIKETITPMSSDFIPKNLNVVFKKESGSTPVNCNVTYNELRDWVERDVPVFAVFIDATNSNYSIYNIIEITLLTDMLGFVYYFSGSSASMSKAFVYKSDGTIEIRSN